jgi:iron complex outermembrane receptor protein
MRSLRLGLFVATSFGLFSQAAFAQANAINIPAQDLKTALAAFIRQSGVELLYDPDILRGQQSHDVRGSYDPARALTLLLQGTDVTFLRDVSGALVITRLPPSRTDNAAEAPIAAAPEFVIVTGTSIRGAAPIGSNVITIDREQIDSTGATTIQQLTATVPAISGFGQSTQSGQGVIGGAGEIEPTIHNLGASSSLSTLILMNGRPLTPSGNLAATDPSIIPIIAIRRVDVMPDGDSAIYGSSAVAGVINFITRSDYEGLQLNAQFGRAQAYQRANLGLMAGHRWDGGSVLLAYEYKSNSNLLSENRAFSQSADLRSQGGANFDSFNCQPATISASSGSSAGLFLYPYSGASIGTTATATPSCDSSGLQSMFPSSSQHIVFVDYKQNIGRRVRVDLNGGYNFRVSTSQNPIAAFSGTAFGPTGSSAALGAASRNPFYVGNATTGTASEFIRWDPTALLGPTHSKGGVQNVYGNLAVTADIGGDWAVELDDTVGLNDAFVNVRDGFCSTCATLALNGTTNSGAAANNSTLNTALADPFNLGPIVSIVRPVNSANALDVWKPADSNRTPAAVLTELKSDQSLQLQRNFMNNVKLKFDGPALTLPAGELKVAIGAEFTQINLEAISTGSDATGPTFAGSTLQDQLLPRTVRSAFLEFAVPLVSAEMTVPLIEKLDLQIAGRWDEYSDAGTTRNPKLGFTWQMIDGLKARGSYGMSFTAPVATFLQGRNSIGPSSASFTIPATHPNYPGSFCTTLAGPCTVGPSAFPGILVAGPNPNLKPMTGQNYSAGLDIDAGEIWRPLTGWVTNITWWKTKFNDAITLVSAIGAGYLTTPGLYQYLEVAPPGGWTQTSPPVVAAIQKGMLTAPLPQTIYYIENRIRVNGFSIIGDGVDFNTQYTVSTGYAGDFQAGFAGSWKLDWGLKGGPHEAPGAYVSYLNGRFDTSVIKAEAFEARANLLWTFDPIRLGLFWNYTNPYWFQTSTGPFATASQMPSGFPTALYSGGFQRVAAYSTIDLNLDYHLSADWLDGLAKGTVLNLNIKNIFSTRPPFFNIGGNGSTAVGFNGNDVFNADPLQRVVSLAIRKTF